MATLLAWLCSLKGLLCSAKGVSLERGCRMLRGLGLAQPPPPASPPHPEGPWMPLCLQSGWLGLERAVVASGQSWPGLCFNLSPFLIEASWWELTEARQSQGRRLGQAQCGCPCLWSPVFSRQKEEGITNIPGLARVHKVCLVWPLKRKSGWESCWLRRPCMGDGAGPRVRGVRPTLHGTPFFPHRH